MDNNIKKTFQQVSANIEYENVKPSIPILARWSTLEKKIEVHEDMILNLRINDDELNFNRILEEETLNLNNLWKEMDHISPRHLLLSTSMVCDKATIFSCLERFFFILLC